MYWLWMIFSDEGHIRVATLSNHILQNLDFAKFILTEVHLPPHTRLNLVKRSARLDLLLFACLMCFRFLAYLSFVICVTANLVTSDTIRVNLHSFRVKFCIFPTRFECSL